LTKKHFQSIGVLCRFMISIFCSSIFIFQVFKTLLGVYDWVRANLISTLSGSDETTRWPDKSAWQTTPELEILNIGVWLGIIRKTKNCHLKSRPSKQDWQPCQKVSHRRKHSRRKKLTRSIMTQCSPISHQYLSPNHHQENLMFHRLLPFRQCRAI